MTLLVNVGRLCPPSRLATVLGSSTSPHYLRLKGVQPTPLGVVQYSSSTSHKINILADLRRLGDTPRPALVLGLAGLIPFAAAPVYMLNSGFLLPEVVTAQLAYGATILSFLGGVRWGLLVQGGVQLPPTWAQYSWSVTPSLLAWCSLLVPEAGLGCAICAASLTLTAYLDLQQSGYPSWFRGLRFLLSLGAVLSLLATLLCIVRLGPKKQASDYLT